MADTKISALPASTVPLAGTEVLPIVQSSSTKQVSVANLTAGRAISATQLTLTTGNLIVASGQGIDFSATSGTGTSELLNDYEEGTWTATLEMAFGTNFTSVSYTNQAGRYTKIGRMVFVQCRLTTSAVTIGSASGVVVIGGLPFNAASGVNSAGSISSSYNWGTSSPIATVVSGGVAYLIKQTTVGGNQDNLVAADVSTGASGNDVFFSACYTI